MSKKIMVTLSDQQYENLSKATDLGETDSEKMRNAFLIYDSMRELISVIKKLKED